MKISHGYLLVLLWASLFVAGPGHAQTESVYINDQLRVGVRDEPDSRATPMGVVVTGDKLEVLERRRSFIRIRTEAGLTGWISDMYVSGEPPAMLKLKILEERHERTRQQLADQEQTIRSLQETGKAVTEQMEQLKAERIRLQARLARSNQQASEAGGESWTWWLMGLLLMGAGAFTGGIVWQRKQTTKRLGGLRV